MSNNWMLIRIGIVLKQERHTEVATGRGVLRMAGCFLLCLLGLWGAPVRADDAESDSGDAAPKASTPTSFQEFVDAVRRGERAAPPAASAGAEGAGYLGWTRYALAKTPEGCATERGLRKQLGTPESVREMAGWKMLDYPDLGLMFLVSPLGNATAVAHDTDTGNHGFNDPPPLDEESDAFYLSPVTVMERLAGYFGGWTGLSYERDDAATRDNGKTQARDTGATTREDVNRAPAPIFTPKEYGVRDRTLRLIRAAM